MTDNTLVGLKRLASVRLTLFCLGMMMILVFIGTLAQVQMGTFAAQKAYFNSFWVYARTADGLKIPIFPGGLIVGGLWLANLLAAFAFHFKWERKSLGLLISHFGLILLLFGQFLAQTLSQESSMPLEIGQSGNYSISPRGVELAIVKTSDPNFDEVTSIPLWLFNHEGTIAPKRLPFTLTIRQFFPNAKLGMAGPGMKSMATQGIGTRIMAVPAPPVTSDDDMNAVTALVEVKDKTRSRGVWLVSSGLGAPQTFNVDGQDYQIFIRPTRTYYPFTLTLKEFHHDIYPGTDIPKNFSSLVHLTNPAKHDSRDTLIYMNHPLRYEGKTFYQASFGNNDRLSVFQVVDNPASVTPYVSCALVILGLAIQFLSHLFEFARKRS
jgi:hypothetical protein